VPLLEDEADKVGSEGSADALADELVVVEEEGKALDEAKDV
jgi:hypothetical protein